MNRSVIVVGLPKAGKSSFIAAISHIIQFNEIPTELTLDRLSAEDQYLYEMRTKWQNCEPFERTAGGPVHSITLHLKTKQDQKLDVFFPDIAGEEFEEQWRGREWSTEFTAAAINASGLLLFLNSLTLEKPRSKADVANAEQAILDAIGALGDEDDSASGSLGGEMQEVVPATAIGRGEAIAKEVATQGSEEVVAVSKPDVWNPRDADAQVKIVDVLQSVASFGDTKRWTLGIVISAWDIVQKQMGDITPEEWLSRTCPFILQYLESNTGVFLAKIFGVSAQGGDPKEDGEKLRAFDSQSTRVELVYGGYRGHDLTRVLEWTMDPK